MSEKKTGRNPMYGQRMQCVRVNLPVETLDKIEQIAQHSLTPQYAIIRNLVMLGLKTLDKEMTTDTKGS